MSIHAWFEHFKEQLQGLTESFEQSGSNLSLLGYALKEQRLSSELYLNWAQDHYKLPKLQSRFFTETSVSQEMFAKWATHYPWSAECLPVAEWDGSLIVACLQPPQDFPQTPSAILVLAHFDSLEQVWEQLHPRAAAIPATATTPVAASPAEEAPEGMDFSVATVTKQGPKDSFSFDDLAVSENENAAPSLEPLSLDQNTSEEGLDGLFDGPTVIRLEALSTAEAPSSEAPVSAEASSDSIVVEFSEGSEPKTQVDEVALTPAATSAPVVEPLVVQEEKAPVVVAVNEALGGKKIPPPPPKSEMPPPFEDSFGNKPIPIVPRPAGVAKPTINPVASGNFALERMKKKNAAILNERVKQILSEMKVHFEKSMILTLDEQETQMTAFAWDENFQGMKDTSMRFPLHTPSIFNIVASTQKSFHGYISLNEINEKFFEDWNQGRIPDHVTISPIIINEKLVGMLMGFAEKAAYNKVSLNLAEKLSVDFVKGLAA
ncbi:hypothetical protein AZI87_12350 [Bdellovibrio bacteriovorus]|uniref:Uncharacterized protein n=1 Tax=Bdellovibrio bacteriovorus TaxID=959 RepID=A0A161PC32_BDEBC|nr:hypothetical protein [Bdellovibrio bacteriovorus]KYG65336.1 hypothetical protein AZI87_12350 [Bdellovibrio bacteriovorus]